MRLTPSWFARHVDRALGPFVDLRPGEGITTLASSLVFSLVTTSYYLIKLVRNSLFVERVGADNLPYVYIATGLVIGLLISWYARHVVDRLRRSMLGVGRVFLAALCLLMRQGALIPIGDPRLPESLAAAGTSLA